MSRSPSDPASSCAACTPSSTSLMQAARARVWTGSANATGAAFGGNVEFLVELEGKKSHCGVDAVIGQRDDGLSLRNLLETYTPRSDEPQEPTPEQRLERRLDAVRRELAGLRFTARVDSDEDDAYQLRLTGEPRSERSIGAGWSGLAIRCRPLTLPAAYARSVDIGTGAHRGRLRRGLVQCADLVLRLRARRS